jgi:hypothetical protein
VIEVLTAGHMSSSISYDNLDLVLENRLSGRGLQIQASSLVPCSR